MSGGASFKDYSDSFIKTTGASTVVPKMALSKEDVALRETSTEAKAEAKEAKQMHQVGDIMRMVNGFVFLTCACGLGLKVPPNYKHDKVRCPRCKKILDIRASGGKSHSA